MTAPNENAIKKVNKSISNDKRNKTEKFIIHYINKILPDGKNAKLYEEKFRSLNDSEFEQFMMDLKSGKVILSLLAPNGKEIKLDVKRNLDIAKELGHEFFQRYWNRTPDGAGWYLSNDKYLVIDVPIRRQAQLLVKKISYAKDNKTIDALTGQPTGKSKGSRISYPELQMMVANGLDYSLLEFMKFRGGDEKGFNAMETSISRTSGVSLKAISPYSGNVKSAETLYLLLTGMHLQNSLFY